MLIFPCRSHIDVYAHIISSAWVALKYLIRGFPKGKQNTPLGQYRVARRAKRAVRVGQTHRNWIQ